MASLATSQVTMPNGVIWTFNRLPKGHSAYPATRGQTKVTCDGCRSDVTHLSTMHCDSGGTSYVLLLLVGGGGGGGVGGGGVACVF